MSSTKAELCTRSLVRIEVDGTAALSKQLVSDIEAGVARTEDQGPNGLLLINILGARDRARLAAWPGQPSVQLVSKWERTLRRLEYSSITSVVFAGDFCSIVALELLLAADYRGANEEFEVNLVGVGGQVWPGMLLYRLVQHIGFGQARKLALFQRRVAVEQALSLGIVDVIAPECVTCLAESPLLLGARSGVERAVRRRLMLDAPLTGYDDALGTHLAACDRVLRRESLAALETEGLPHGQADEHTLGSGA